MSVRTNTSLAIALAVAAVSSLPTAARAGETAGAATVSVSGSTAMRGFTTGLDFGALTPGTTLLINGNTFTATNTPTTKVQLAYKNDAVPSANSSAPTSNANFLAFRVEYHEQGSVEGIAELANDQIGTIPSVVGSARNPQTQSSLGVGNRTFINGNQFNGVGTLNGFTLSPSNYNTYADYNSAGSNTAGGQNRVQMGISDVRALQGFSVDGTASVTRRAGDPGYGKGNPALLVSSTANNLLGLGDSSVRRQLIPTSALNMDTTASGNNDPATGNPYAAGPWNNAGINNLDNRIVAVTATTFAANPGTGLTDVNRDNAKWLQTTGRLANGADFNVATRDINSGTLNVAANNVGIDPSFAVGENDSGNGLTGTNNETVIGSNIKFSGKTSGGSQLRPTVAAARMGIGHLSISDIRGGPNSNATISSGTTASPNNGFAPLRALAFRNTEDNTGAPVKVSFDSITDGSYALFQNETYVTVKDPTLGAAAITAYKALPGNSGLSDAQAWAALTDAQTGIKGDTGRATVAGDAVPTYTLTASTGNVSALRNNILNSTGTFPVNSGGIRNPASGLLSAGFIPTKFMQVQKVGDGEVVGPNPTFDSSTSGLNTFTAVKNAYQSNFDVGDAASVTTGTNAIYGSDATANIPITINNYLFGDFNNDGKRDFQDLKYAQTAQSALKTQAGVNWKTLTDGTTVGVNNSTPVTGLTISASKGDLIVKGDYNADGSFDGKDLYAFAHGAALATAGLDTDTIKVNPDAGQLAGGSASAISDQYRTGTLYKNAALDYLNSAGVATLDQKTAAAYIAPGQTTPTANAIANAFNKLDVNRDGNVDRKDAQIVDTFVNNASPQSIENLQNQLDAVVRTDGNPAGTAFVNSSGQALDPANPATSSIPRKSISLVDVELNDNKTITHIVSGGGTSDMKIVADSLVTAGVLKRGDVNFDGFVNGTDLFTVTSNFSNTNSTRKWSQGDTVTYDGITNGPDLFAVTSSFNNTAYAAGSTGSGSVTAFAGTTGVADLVYNSVTGNVSIALDGASSVSAFALTNDAGGLSFIPANFIAPSSTIFQTVNGETITWQVQDFQAGFTTGPVNIGNIFPSGLTAQQLAAFLTQYQYNFGSGNLATFDLTVVPEPTSLAVIGLGAVSMLRRRRQA